MKTEIAHVLFIDIVAWSKGSIEKQATSVGELTERLKATPTFRDGANPGLVPTGDGMAVLFFGDVYAPAACASELEDGLAVPVRMGIHSGPVGRQADVGGHENYVGEGIVLAKRVLDFAEPGEILLSDTYARWLLHSDRWASRVEDRGEGMAKHGVPIRLHRLRSAAAPAAPARAANGKGRIALLSRRGAEPDDRALATLESGLAGLGYEVDVDRHTRIGLDWARSIERRIREADVVIALLSEASLKSEMLQGEIEIARAAADDGGRPRLLAVRVGATEGDSGLGMPVATWNSPTDDAAVVKAIERALRGPTAPVSDPLAESDSGGVSPNSPFYLERPTDPAFHRALEAVDPILLIKGPRQVGKTSLLARAVKATEAAGRRRAFTDFQKFGGAVLASDEAFYRAVAKTVAKQIEFEYDFAEEWDPIYGATMNMENFLRAAVEADDRPLVWMMDEADKLFGLPFASDFFGLVRSWHNSRATDPGGGWERLCIVIAYATEAHLFIQDLNQSPFNVGRRFDMTDFEPSHLEDLDGRCGSPLGSEAARSRLRDLIGGHPFLTRRAMNALVGGLSLDVLAERATWDDGPFGDHLKRLLLSVSRREAVLDTLRSVLHGRPGGDPESLARLSASGVIVHDSSGIGMRNRLYRSYLTEHLPA